MSTMTRTKADWRWIDKSTLVADHGRRPVVLAADDNGQLVQRGPEGLLVQIDPKHPDMKAIAGSARLIQAVEAFLSFRTSIFPEVSGPEECDALEELEKALEASGGKVPYAE